MSKVLVIPDIHLKPVMFDKAEKYLSSGEADFAIQMGDMVDDWGEEFNISLYDRTLMRAIKFQKDHPNTLWVMGNHDYGYWHPDMGVKESGHSKFQEGNTLSLLQELERQGGEQKIMHVVDNVIFTHAGLTETWVKRQKLLIEAGWGDFETADLLRLVNFAAPAELWLEESPIWARPQVDEYDMYPAKLQVVGHTPMKTPTERWGVLSTDVFSTYRNGAPYGDQQFVIVDTQTGEWKNAGE